MILDCLPIYFKDFLRHYDVIPKSVLHPSSVNVVERNREYLDVQFARKQKRARFLVIFSSFLLFLFFLFYFEILYLKNSRVPSTCSYVSPKYRQDRVPHPPRLTPFRQNASPSHTPHTHDFPLRTSSDLLDTLIPRDKYISNNASIKEIAKNTIVWTSATFISSFFLLADVRHQNVHILFTQPPPSS